MNHKSRTSRWTRARAIMALGMALGLTVAVTMAVFTDKAEFTSKFSTGNVDIKVSDDDPATYEFADWKMENAKAGKVVYAPLTVTNAGTLDFTYQMSPAVIEAEPLGAEIDVVITQVAAPTDCGAEGVSGAPVTSGKLNAVAITTPRKLASTASGSTEPTSEILCFKAQIPTDPASDITGQEVNPVFTLTATQS